jgi:diphthamide synthase (EF-2-diphthine--ammonia ligase)
MKMARHLLEPPAAEIVGLLLEDLETALARISELTRINPEDPDAFTLQKRATLSFQAAAEGFKERAEKAEAEVAKLKETVQRDVKYCDSIREKLDDANQRLEHRALVIGALTLKLEAEKAKNAALVVTLEKLKPLDLGEWAKRLINDVLKRYEEERAERR